MTKDEALTVALTVALEALENSVDLMREDAYKAEKLYGNYPTRQGKVGGLKVLADDHEKAIAAIREALEQPVQEPVGFIDRHDLSNLSAAKRATAPLLDRQSLSTMPGQADAHLRALLWFAEDFYCTAIEHGMKAGPAANSIAHVERAGKALHQLVHAQAKMLQPLPVQPVQEPVGFAVMERPWVGLTDCERRKLRSEADEADTGYKKLIKATEAKLKEKNT